MIALSLLVLLAAGEEMAAVAPGALEGRPPAAQASPLQALIDAAPPGSTVEIAAGIHVGDLVIDRPLRLAGTGRPLLIGSGAGSVIRVRADDVTIEGLDIDGRSGGDLGRDSAGVHTSARRTTVRDCRITNSLFGIYLRAADGAVIERCTIRGIPGRDPGEKGSGIHAWNTNRFSFLENTVIDVRDGFYIQSSSHGFVRGNVARDLRYGLHYMFSDDNVFEDNVFADSAAGTAIMYSNRIAFRRNSFLHNRGFASVGLLFKNCEDVVAEDNLIADNARGVFLEGSYRSLFRGNVIAASDTAVVLYDSCDRVRFEGNSFVGNLTPLTLVGRRTSTIFAGNYWSDNGEPDLDGDGRSDRPYRLSSVFDHFRGNLTAADLMALGPAGPVLSAAERAFPVLRQVPVLDSSPLTRPPSLPRVPSARSQQRRFGAAAVAASTGLVFAGTGVLAVGRRRRRSVA